MLAARRYRSRRFWRTISRRRRTIGLLLLFVLISAVWAGFYYTRPTRVEKLTEEFLTKLTGLDVRIGRASFSPFEGIRLYKVVVLPRSDQGRKYYDVNRDAMFMADEVLLEVDPASLVRGQLKVSRMVALRPTLRQVLLSGETPNSQPDVLGPRRDRIDITQFPIIELREARYVRYVRMEGEAHSDDDQVDRELALNVTLTPDPDRPEAYVIRGQMGRTAEELEPLEGGVSLNPLSIWAKAENLELTKLPLMVEVEQAIRKFGIEGSLGASGRFDAQSGASVGTIDLKGNRMLLPLDTLGLRGEKRSDGTWASPPPLELTRVFGRIVVTREAVRRTSDGSAPEPRREEIRFEDVHGLVHGQAFTLSGSYGAFRDTSAPFDLHLEMPRFEFRAEDREFFSSIDPQVRRIWNQFDPRGLAWVGVDIERKFTGGPEDVHVVASVHLLDASASYRWYPYRFEHLTGTVVVDNILGAAVLTNIRGTRPDGGRLRVDGAVHFKGRYQHPMDVHVVGENLVDSQKDMEQVLSVSQAKYLDVIRELGLSGGRFDFDCRVTSEDSPDAHSRTEFSIRLHDVNMTFEKFPYPVRVVSGEVTLIPNGVALGKMLLMPLHLQPDDVLGKVMMDGRIIRGPDGADVKLDVVCPSASLDDTLWNALPEDIAGTLRQYHISGRAELVGSIVKKPGGPLALDIYGKLTRGRLNYDGFPYGLTDMTGRVHLTSGRLELSDIEGQHNGVPISGQGGIGLARGEKTRLMIRSDRVPLDDDLYKALKPGAQEQWRQFNPSGWVGLDVAISQGAAPAPDKPRPEMDVVVTVTCLGNGIRYAQFPYPLDRVTGQVIIHPGDVTLLDVTEEQGKRQISVAGKVWPGVDNLDLQPGQTAKPKLDVKIVARNMRFDETLRRTIPWRARRKWNTILPGGDFDLNLTRLVYTPLGETGQWYYQGRLDLRNARAVMGIRLEELTGTISGKGILIPGASSGFVGQLNLAEVTASGHRLTDVRTPEGGMVQDARSDELRIGGLTGRAYGGQFNGMARFGSGEGDLPYAVSLAVHDLGINELINRGRQPDDRVKAAGLLSGNINVNGKANRGSRYGDGEFQLTRAQIYEVPTVLKILNAGNLVRKPGSSQAAQMVFHFNGDRVTFEEIVMRDPVLALRGTGTMNWGDKKLDMTLVAGEPNKSGSGTNVLEELFSGAGEELMKYRVTGTMEKPEVEAIPLHTVRDAIEELAAARRRYEEEQRRHNPPPAVNGQQQ
ncbi:MAG: hypothetical protein BIFFINMI_02210 [Phycisphaerae bacterium]|nr:hypothetical protein [Phycisphaerae bacterium]